MKGSSGDNMKISCPKRRFSLIELLVVVAILALLMALLMPTLNSVHQTTRRLACASQLQQLGVAYAVYAEDFNDLYPAYQKGTTSSEPNEEVITRRMGVSGAEPQFRNCPLQNWWAPAWTNVNSRFLTPALGITPYYNSNHNNWFCPESEVLASEEATDFDRWNLQAENYANNSAPLNERPKDRRIGYYMSVSNQLETGVLYHFAGGTRRVWTNDNFKYAGVMNTSDDPEQTLVSDMTWGLESGSRNDNYMYWVDVKHGDSTNILQHNGAVIMADVQAGFDPGPTDYNDLFDITASFHMGTGLYDSSLRPASFNGGPRVATFVGDLTPYLMD